MKVFAAVLALALCAAAVQAALVPIDSVIAKALDKSESLDILVRVCFPPPPLYLFLYLFIYLFIYLLLWIGCSSPPARRPRLPSSTP